MDTFSLFLATTPWCRGQILGYRAKGTGSHRDGKTLLLPFVWAGVCGLHRSSPTGTAVELHPPKPEIGQDGLQVAALDGRHLILAWS